MSDAEVVVKQRTTNLFGNQVRISGPFFPPSRTPDLAHIATVPNLEKNIDHQTITTGLREEGMGGDPDNIFEVFQFFTTRNFFVNSDRNKMEILGTSLDFNLNITDKGFFRVTNLS